MSSPDVYQPLKLDQDIVADRRRSIEADPLRIKMPEDISRDSVFEILDHIPGNVYDIHFSSGTWHQQEQFIHYQPDGSGTVTLSITHNNEKLFGVVVYENGMVYDDHGTITRDALSDGKGKIEKLDIDLSELITDTNIIDPPIPTNRDGGLNSTSSNLLSYDVQSLFGDLDSKHLTKNLSNLKNGNVSDYFLPSESNKQKDAEPGVYELDGNKIGFIPRNSNVNESEGSVLVGYRTPGAVGGSLTVITGDERPLRKDTWMFEVDGNDLEAIMPDDIIALCLTTISFSPILKGDPEGHTFYWEQIKGDDSSITWLTPNNQPNIVLELGPLKVDRTFRFWIDKGTKREKYYDVQIHGTPFEKITGFSSRDVPNDFSNHLNILEHDTGPILLWHRNVWNKQLRLKIIQKF